MSRPDGSLRGLEAIVGAGHVLTGPAAAPYGVDWTGRWQAAPTAVVLPASTEEVAGVLAHCCDRGLAVVPQGGNTGLVGGGTPLGGELVLSLRRLGRCGPVDAVAWQLTAQGGATLSQVEDQARGVGLRYPIDLASAGSATVGGTIATNAGGARVLAHGSTRHQIRGLEVVLADGTVLSDLSGLEKDSAGYDLASMVCGSEGTLAVVTAARLRLVPVPAVVCAVLAGTSSLEEGIELARAVQRQVGGLEAAEYLDAVALETVCHELGLPAPLGAVPPVTVLVEVVGEHEDHLLARLDEVIGGGDTVSAHATTAVATADGRRARLWRYRHALPEALAARGVPTKLDVSVPLTELGRATTAIRARVAEAVPQAKVITFGHLLDGNLHVNVLDADPEDRVVEAVLDTVVAHGGSIAAEHGIGRAKMPYLALRRGDGQRRLFTRLKQAFDPTGVLNPGVLVDPRA